MHRFMREKSLSNVTHVSLICQSEKILSQKETWKDILHQSMNDKSHSKVNHVNTYMPWSTTLTYMWIQSMAMIPSIAQNAMKNLPVKTWKSITKTELVHQSFSKKVHEKKKPNSYKYCHKGSGRKTMSFNMSWNFIRNYILQNYVKA